MIEAMQRLLVKRVVVVAVALLLASVAAPAKDKGGKWIKMFDGKSLKGWKTADNPESWKAVGGELVGKGLHSHLFWMVRECENCEFKAEVLTKPKTNSGMYFRTAFGPGFPKGYEAQVDNTHRDPVRTGSLYNFVKIFDQLVKDDVWFTQHIIANGNHIVIKVNDKVVVDYVDEKNTFTKGYLALQQHDPSGEVHYRNLMMRVLPPKK
jgi:hypothetical protein